MPTYLPAKAPNWKGSVSEIAREMRKFGFLTSHIWLSGINDNEIKERNNSIVNTLFTVGQMPSSLFLLFPARWRSINQYIRKGLKPVIFHVFLLKHRVP